MFYNTDLTSTSEMVDLHKGYLVQLEDLHSEVSSLKLGEEGGESGWRGGGGGELMGAWVLNQT